MRNDERMPKMNDIYYMKHVHDDKNIWQENINSVQYYIGKTRFMNTSFLREHNEEISTNV